MATKAHELSARTTLPEADLWSVPQTQDIIEANLTTEHKPISPIEPSSFIQFEIPTSVNEYLRFSDLYLYIKLKPTCKPKASATVVDWTKIGVINNLLHSMIKQVDVFIGDTQITSSPSTYPYRAYFETLLGFFQDAKNSHLSSALWFNDENDKTVDKVVAKTTKYCKDGKEMELIGRLHLDMAQQSRLLLGGCKTTVRILLNDPKFFFLTKDTYFPEMEYIDASLYANRSKVSQELVEAHNIALAVSNAKYFISHNKVKACTIQKGTYDAHIDNVHSGQHVRRIFLAFVKNSAYCGAYGENPFFFDNFKINQLCAYLDGHQYPSKAFTPDFDNGLIIREQHALYEALNMLQTDSTLNINRDNYSVGNTIFGFNFAPDLSNGCCGVEHLNQIKYGSLRIQIRFKEALSEPITALVYCEFDKVLEIDSSRNAAIDFI